ncbi:UDP-glycosyltransferase 82A1 [Benincasa hispida]|uniref:UDP-glycosyltransferase 82A1 n=1 Tax=Benincasa hispida TaxID=102211 RepID=UPI0019025447|nr:UDP-glycosyltransferase 82A1 [Benincasa hispida]
MKYFSKKPKIILVPYPAQGHVTPMLMLAAVFYRRDFLPILLTPNYIHRHISSQISSTDEILFISMPDGLDDNMPRDFFTIETAMETIMPIYLRRVLSEHSSKENNDGSGVVCMVVDLLASSAIEVGKEFGVTVVGFWPAMFATYKLISNIPEMIHNNFISSDTGCPEEGSKGCVPSQPLVSAEELPWLIGTSSARKGRFKFWKRTMARAKSLKCLLVNSFPEEVPLQKPISKSSTAVFLVGPLSRHSNPAKTPSFWEEDGGCVEWLEKQRLNSVVYISFGSWVSPINESKVRSLAMALLALRKPFLWVLKSNWRDGLPIGFQQKTQSYGRVVSWAPQIEILKHKAVGCYLSHCGWNSIMEAIQCRKRLLCFPVAGDQFLNCGYVVKVWRIGVRLNGFGEKEVEEGVRKVMEDGEMKGRLMKLHDRIMGEEANYRVNSNFTAFINEINKLPTKAGHFIL